MKKIARALLLITVLGVLGVSPTGASLQTKNPPEYYTYWVYEGDTLEEIAWWFFTTPEAIAKANGIADPKLLQVDQELEIPTDGLGEAGIYQFGWGKRPAEEPFDCKEGVFLSAFPWETRYGTEIIYLVHVWEKVPPGRCWTCEYRCWELKDCVNLVERIRQHAAWYTP